VIEYENLREANRPFFKEYQESFAKTLESGWFILGSNVAEFEKEFAVYVGSPHCVGLASGLDALILALKALDLPEGSEVIVPSNTYIATILAIIQNRLVPVLVEPDIRTYNIDPARIEEKLTPKTSAIMVVHLYGKACDMDPIMEICRRRKLRLVEDCAQAHGAKYKGRMVGSFGDFGAFSFYPTKNLGALGDAGAIVANDETLARTVRILRNYGSEKKYYNELVGYNSRLQEIQAGFLRIKLRHLDEINEHKRRLARVYLEGLSDAFVKPDVRKDFHDVYHIFNIRSDRRDELRDYLLKNEIKTDIHYPVSPNRQKAMVGILDHVSCPISEEIHKTTVSLPISFAHATSDIERVVEVMNKFR
jgi:dTDP-4-amino-4,6-dideoxygalactose transaminase